MTKTPTMALALIVVASFSLVAIVPTGLATNNGDTIARTFPQYVVGVEWKDGPDGTLGGAGYYDPVTDAEVCLFRLFGLRVALSPGAFYYETLRVYTNPSKHLTTVTPPAPIDPGVPCPLSPDTPPFNVIGSTPFNIWEGGLIDLSVLECSGPGVVCIPQTGEWFLATCKAQADSGTFTGPLEDKPIPVRFTPGDIIEEPSGSVLVGSSELECDGNGNGVFNEFEDFGHYYNATPFLDPGDPTVSDFFPPQIGDIATPGHGDAYVVSCWRGTILHGKLGAVVEVADYDWFLTLDRGNPQQWVHDTARHLGVDLNNPPGNLNLPGLYDLSGNPVPNAGGAGACPFDIDNPLIQDCMVPEKDKKKLGKATKDTDPNCTNPELKKKGNITKPNGGGGENVPLFDLGCTVVLIGGAIELPDPLDPTNTIGLNDLDQEEKHGSCQSLSVAGQAAMCHGGDTGTVVAAVVGAPGATADADFVCKDDVGETVIASASATVPGAPVDAATGVKVDGEIRCDLWLDFPAGTKAIGMAACLEHPL